jgi:adenine deaminase
MLSRDLQLVDVHRREIRPARIVLEGDRIVEIADLPEDSPLEPGFLLPGFIDAHVHVESSMLPPTEFARVAVRHGTVATVSDPHEIANVLGEEGIEFMLADAARACMPITFGVPSCVPATDFECAGATLGAIAVERLLADPQLGYLSEMMNWPGVLGEDAEVMAKIAAAHRLGKPVDGHAPGLRGEDAGRYVSAGISTDHECFTLDEARDKVAAGMRILIREGSAARNLEALWPILGEHPDRVMLCSDDAHPDDLLHGHLDLAVARHVGKGLDLFDVLHAACVHPVEHYGLPVGLLRVGDRADFIVVDDLDSFRVRETWIAGACVARNGKSLTSHTSCPTPNRFRDHRFAPDDFALRVDDDVPRTVAVIEVEDGELITGRCELEIRPTAQILEPDPGQDALLLTVCNRYKPAPPSLAFVRHLGLQRGAIASSVAHDSHNVIAAGADRDAICTAINAVFEHRGGLAVVHDRGVDILPLPIAGLMSDRPAEEVADAYERLTHLARGLGSELRAPFMTLSFLALLVIPALKLGDRGLFDGQKFAFVQPIVR